MAVKYKKTKPVQELIRNTNIEYETIIYDQHKHPLQNSIIKEDLEEYETARTTRKILIFYNNPSDYFED